MRAAVVALRALGGDRLSVSTCAGLLVPRLLLHPAHGHRPRLLRQPVPPVVAGWLGGHLHPPGSPPADLRLPRQLRGLLRTGIIRVCGRSHTHLGTLGGVVWPGYGTQLTHLGWTPIAIHFINECRNASVLSNALPLCCPPSPPAVSPVLGPLCISPPDLSPTSLPPLSHLGLLALPPP